MPVSAPTLHVNEALGAVSGTLTSVTMSEGIGAPDVSLDQISPFLGIEMHVYRWDDLPADTYVISQVWTFTSPADTSPFTVIGGVGSRLFLVTGNHVNEMWAFVIEVTGAAAVGTPVEVGVDGTGASQNIASTIGGRVMAFLCSNWDSAQNQTPFADELIVSVTRLAGQHADGDADPVPMNFTGTVDQGAYIGFNIEEAASANDTLTVDSQPSTGLTGVPLSNIVIDSSDTGFTGNVTVTLESGSGSLSGTLTVAAVAGVATFSNVLISGVGVHTLAFNATDHDEVISGNITISLPPPRQMLLFVPPS